MKKYVKNFKNFPGFVNKYEGRSNGGIPCFSEERLNERAAKVLYPGIGTDITLCFLSPPLSLII